MGLSESSLTTITKPFSFQSHCKVSCDSPGCTKVCGEEHHCVFHIDTHENANSDSDEDEDTYTTVSKQITINQKCFIFVLLGGEEGLISLNRRVLFP